MKINLIKLCTGTMISAALLCGVTAHATQPNMETVYTSLPTYNGDDLELKVDNQGTHFTLWSPQAEAAQVLLYNTDCNTPSTATLEMKKSDNGTWRVSVPEQLYGKFYTFRIKFEGKWLDETPGVWAKAVGTNGRRAAIIDFATTNPAGWENDKGPEIGSIADVIIYEMHHRDFSIHPSSGIVNKGKFLALTE